MLIKSSTPITTYKNPHPTPKTNTPRFTEESKHFDKLVKDSFQFKRKTIKNNLINKYNLDIVSKVLEKYGYDLSMRSEKIPYYVFVEISNELLK